jgi:FkbM family methyltransferase
MEIMWKYLRKLVIALLRFSSRSSTLSKVVLGFVAFFVKPFPDRRFKEFVLSSLYQVKWPTLSLKEQTVIVGSDTRLRVIPHTNEFDLEALVYRVMKYERELYAVFDKEVANFDVVFDIGANIGLFSLFCSKRNPSARVISFEPSPEAFRRLLLNRSLNDLEFLSVFNAAVSENSGFVKFYEPKGHLTNGSIHKDFASRFSDNYDEVNVLAIGPDDLFTLLHKRDRLLIKIDVEGAEFEVLTALKDQILLWLPSIIIEVLEEYTEKLNSLTFLFEKYDLFHISNNGLKRMGKFEAYPTERDYYLIPKNES